MKDEELDETARLVLMELGAPNKRPQPRLLEFAHMLRQAAGEEVGVLEVGQFWGKYMGWDGRSWPTHDLETGERIVRL